jgi:hypothetical protein
MAAKEKPYTQGDVKALIERVGGQMFVINVLVAFLVGKGLVDPKELSTYLQPIAAKHQGTPRGEAVDDFLTLFEAAYRVRPPN